LVGDLGGAVRRRLWEELFAPDLAKLAMFHLKAGKL